MQVPKTRHMFTMLLPMTFPRDIPTASSFLVLNIATVSSGREVDSEINMNPTAVFPKPVISAILSLLIIVHLLKFPSRKRATSKTARFCTI